MKKSLYFLTLCFFCVTGLAMAHGVVHEVSTDSSIIIKVEYEEGGAMSYADVFVYSPDDEKVEYQNGRTDKNGVFAFVPDKPGVWKVKVDDGMGHGLVTKVTVKNGMAVNISHNSHSQKDNIIAALGIIIGVIGFLFYWKAKNKK
ncbi:MAG: DUF4198 domain-containing protein [Calditrichaeota bacterium]|nr:DUF4198 domain-containing protein [Calditrichota bacterium]